MLAAVTADFARLPQVKVVSVLAPSLSALPDTTCIRSTAGEEEATFRRLAAEADATLVIAPELDELLLHRCRWVTESGGRLLGPSLGAVRLTGDKWALAKHWRERGIPTPDTVLIESSHARADARAPALVDGSAVLKPRHGAGSLATFVVHGDRQYQDALAAAQVEMPRADFLVQPLVAGRAASVAFLLGREMCLPLPPAWQILSSDGRLRYHGGELPIPQPWAGRAQRLAQRAINSVPGLFGYVGVDLILGEARDGSGDVAIEINPRLTTSYVGLRHLARFNLAAALLSVIRGEPIPLPAWSEGQVGFRSDGTIC